MAETTKSPSEEYFRSIKNDIIGSVGRKLAAYRSGLWGELLNAATTMSSQQMLFQIVPSLIAIIRDVPESIEDFRKQREGLACAAEFLLHSEAVAFRKVGLRLLEAMADLDCIPSWPRAVCALSKAASDSKLVSLSSSVLARGLKAGLSFDIPESVFVHALEAAVGLRQPSAQLDALLTVVSFGIARNTRVAQRVATEGEFLAVVLNCLRGDSESLRLSSLRITAALTRLRAIPNRDDIIQAIVPTLCQICLRGDREACEILSGLSAGDPDVQRVLRQQGFVKDFASVLMREVDSKEGVLLQVGLRCIAAAIDETEESRQDVFNTEEFLAAVIKLLPDSAGVVKRHLLELLFALSRSTRDLKPVMLTESVPTTLSEFLDDPDLCIRLLVLKLLCNTVLDYQNLDVDISAIIGKVCALVHTPETREISLKVVKNLTFLDKMEVKHEVFKHISAEELIVFIRTGSDNERIEALCVIRNLLFPSVEEVEAVLSAAEEELIRLLEELLERRPERLLIHALYAVCNIASGGERHKLLIVDSRMVADVLQLTRSGASPSAPSPTDGCARSSAGGRRRVRAGFDGAGLVRQPG